MPRVRPPVVHILIKLSRRDHKNSIAIAPAPRTPHLELGTPFGPPSRRPRRGETAWNRPPLSSVLNPSASIRPIRVVRVLFSSHIAPRTSHLVLETHEAFCSLTPEHLFCIMCSCPLPLPRRQLPPFRFVGGSRPSLRPSLAESICFYLFYP